jgi:hypothetical protein
MEKGDSMTNPNDPATLDKLSVLLADASTRKLFFLDPDATLEAADIDPAGIPAAFMNALRELDYGELGLLSRMNIKLVEGGLAGDNVLNWPV